jgi:hypothetical protein
MLTTHPYTIKLWYPSSADETTFTYALVMKAPEIGNTNLLGRNQQSVRTRSGKTLVYDRGINLNQNMHLEFKDIFDSERSALVVFLDMISWGASKIKYKDHLGTIRTVRVISNSIQYTDNGMSNTYRSLNQITGQNETLWNFSLDLIDITGTPEEFEGEDAPVTSLALHIADTNHPHNPKTQITIAANNVWQTVETIPVDNFKFVSWFALMEFASYNSSRIVTAVHNGTLVADATTVDFSDTELATIGALTVQYRAILIGTGAGQILVLQVYGPATAVISVRRVKI